MRRAEHVAAAAGGQTARITDRIGRAPMRKAPLLQPRERSTLRRASMDAAHPHYSDALPRGFARPATSHRPTGGGNTLEGEREPRGFRGSSSSSSRRRACEPRAKGQRTDGQLFIWNAMNVLHFVIPRRRRKKGNDAYARPSLPPQPPSPFVLTSCAPPLPF